MFYNLFPQKYDVIVKDNPEGPKLKDPFWDDLEKGKINLLDGHDMYSKIKSGRAARPTSFKDSKERRRRTKTADDEGGKREKHKRSKTSGDGASGDGMMKKSGKNKLAGEKKRSSASRDSISTVGSRGSKDSSDEGSASGDSDSLGYSHSSFGTSLGSLDDARSQSQAVGDDATESLASRREDAASMSHESLKTSPSESSFTASKESSQTSSQNLVTSASEVPKQPEKPRTLAPRITMPPAKMAIIDDDDDDDFLPDLSYIPSSSSQQYSQSNQKLDKSKISDAKLNSAIIKKSDSSGSASKKPIVRSKKGKDVNDVKLQSESDTKDSKSSVVNGVDLPEMTVRSTVQDSSTKEKKSDTQPVKSSGAKEMKTENIKTVKSGAKETKSETTQAAATAAVKSSSVKETKRETAQAPSKVTGSKESKSENKHAAFKSSSSKENKLEASQVVAKSTAVSGVKENKTETTQAASKLAVRTTSRDSISSRRIQVIDAMPILNPELPVIKGKQHKDDHKSRRTSKDDSRSSKRSHRGSVDTETVPKVKTWEERRASIDNVAEKDVSTATCKNGTWV